VLLACQLTDYSLAWPLQQSDEEPVDPMADIRKECAPTRPKQMANCDACKDQTKDKPGVSCEIWHYELHHCVDKCVAPKILLAHAVGNKKTKRPLQFGSHGSVLGITVGRFVLMARQKHVLKIFFWIFETPIDLFSLVHFTAQAT